MKHAKASIAGRLAVARSLAKPALPARELDRLAGLHQGHVWAIESGHRPNIETDTCIALAKVLGVSLDWLLTGEGDAPDADAVRAAVQTARETSDARDSQVG